MGDLEERARHLDEGSRIRYRIDGITRQFGLMLVAVGRGTFSRVGGDHESSIGRQLTHMAEYEERGHDRQQPSGNRSRAAAMNHRVEGYAAPQALSTNAASVEALSVPREVGDGSQPSR